MSWKNQKICKMISKYLNGMFLKFKKIHRTKDQFLQLSLNLMATNYYVIIMLCLQYCTVNVCTFYNIYSHNFDLCTLFDPSDYFLNFYRQKVSVFRVNCGESPSHPKCILSCLFFHPSTSPYYYF